MMKKQKVKDHDDQSQYQDQPQRRDGGKHIPRCVQIGKYGSVDGEIPVFVDDQVREKQRIQVEAGW